MTSYIYVNNNNTGINRIVIKKTAEQIRVIYNDSLLGGVPLKQIQQHHQQQPINFE